jgi:hypothetical protein
MSEKSAAALVPIPFDALSGNTVRPTLAGINFQVHPIADK